MRSVVRFGCFAVLWFVVETAAAQPDASVEPADAPPRSVSPLPLNEPPRRWDSWQAPETALPAEAVAAVAKLFEIGLPDPRDCEYRSVTVTTRPHGRKPIETRAWVIPSRDRDAAGRPIPRYGICWNGQIHPAVEIGEPANLEADAKAALAILQGAEAPRPSFGSVRVDAPHPVRIALLLRIGETELAEDLYTA
ncbi:MAG: hypothetical protein WBC44_20560, partial [Planctomycetaceae bacterium]